MGKFPIGPRRGDTTINSSSCGRIAPPKPAGLAAQG